MRNELPRPEPFLVLVIMLSIIGWGAIELLYGVFSLFGITIF